MKIKGIVGHYIEMFREMGITTILEAKRRITEEDRRYFRISPEQHKVKYYYLTLKHINKISSRSKTSIRASQLNQYRERMLVELDDLISRATDKKERECWESTRTKIEEQLIPPLAST